MLVESTLSRGIFGQPSFSSRVGENADLRDLASIGVRGRGVGVRGTRPAIPTTDGVVGEGTRRLAAARRERVGPRINYSE